MAQSSYHSPQTTDIQTGLDVRKKTTRVNIVLVLAVLIFFILGTALVLKVMRDPPQTPADANPLTR